MVKRILILAHPPRALDGSLSETADSGRSVRQCVKEALQEVGSLLRVCRICLPQYHVALGLISGSQPDLVTDILSVA